MVEEKLVLGLDFGTDSVRAVLVNNHTGNEEAVAACPYTRWQSGLYTEPGLKQFRHHPLDYLESLQQVVKEALAMLSPQAGRLVCAIGIDTTGSTPCAVDRPGVPLALHEPFKDNPQAMFMLWKDHTAIEEAELINTLAHSGKYRDYTKYSGGAYSAEWFWAKLLHVINQDSRFAGEIFSWVELCDYLPALLTGTTDPLTMKRSRCAAGHKAMWHEEWNGLPDVDYLSALNPRLGRIRDNLYRETLPSDQKAGALSAEWSEKLNLPVGIAVAVGTLDAHAGAVGGGIQPGSLFKIIGTSTCDIAVARLDDLGQRQIRGIAGQVFGSVLPGHIGLEAGQSSFGDVYAWFKDLLLWPFAAAKFPTQEVESFLIERLSEEAAALKPGTEKLTAIDWFNGRRSPYGNQRLTGAIVGLTLSASAPALFRALVEATVFGAKAIVDHFSKEGIAVNEIIALGGIAKKNTFIMQMLADVLEMPIKVVASEQASALGAAIYASVAAGLFASVEEAQQKLCGGYSDIYTPEAESALVYRHLYQDYLLTAALIEKQLELKHDS